MLLLEIFSCEIAGNVLTLQADCGLGTAVFPLGKNEVMKIIVCI